MATMTALEVVSQLQTLALEAQVQGIAPSDYTTLFTVLATGLKRELEQGPINSDSTIELGVVGEKLAIARLGSNG